MDHITTLSLHSLTAIQRVYTDGSRKNRLTVSGLYYISIWTVGTRNCAPGHELSSDDDVRLMCNIIMFVYIYN